MSTGNLYVYVAAPFIHRDEARHAREVLRSKGYICTSTWIDGPGTSYDSNDWEMLAEEARKDIKDLRMADVLVLLNLPGSRGAMHIETGIALETGKKIYLVGYPTAVFHYIPEAFDIVARVESIPNVC